MPALPVLTGSLIIARRKLAALLYSRSLELTLQPLRRNDMQLEPAKTFTNILATRKIQSAVAVPMNRDSAGTVQMRAGCPRSRRPAYFKLSVAKLRQAGHLRSRLSFHHSVAAMRNNRFNPYILILLTSLCCAPSAAQRA